IWHAVFGVAGANNDINVLDNSLLFDDLLDDKAPVAPYVVNGVEFEKGYYFADASISFKTPKAVIHHEFIDTPGGSVYWVPRVSASVLPVLGTVYDSLDECIEMYRKYASEADPNKNDRQVRSSNFRVCGCKARVVFDMVPHSSKYTLTTFDVEHNHELDKVEYKHLSKAERKLTYNEHLFIIKAANANIGVVRAHNLYTGLKGSSSLVHGLLKKETAEAYGWLLRAFKKAFVRAPNIVVTDQDGAMRHAIAAEFPESKHRLCMCHIMQKIPAKFKRFILTRAWYKMVFVPLNAIDNHRRSVTVGSGLLKRETAGSLWMVT
ncbi:FAR1-related sequence 5-like protein, partial [Tanacetum coccineum]